MEHIDLTSKNHDDSRLIPVRAYLAGRLSPLDLSLIVNLHDHEGTLEVYFDKQRLDYAVKLAGEDYINYLFRNIRDAWLIEYEELVSFYYSDGDYKPFKESL